MGYVLDRRSLPPSIRRRHCDPRSRTTTVGILSSRRVDWDRFRQVSSPVCRVLANLPFAQSPPVAPPFRRPSAVGSLAELHHCNRLVMEKPPVRPEIDIGAPAAASPPAAVVLEPLLTELTRSTVNPPLTELTRSTQSTEQIQHPSSAIPTSNLPKKTFAEVLAPTRASKTATPAPHKYFPADLPSPGIGTVLTGDKGPTLLFTDAETEVLAAPFKFALVGKFSHGAPSYSILHKLIAGTGIKNKFTEVLFTVASMIGTPLQIDDATLNQSKLSKARACIELDLLKPRLENFQIQICGTTIVQRIEYEDIPHYCSLCKHVGHQDSDCYSKGDAPKPPPRKPSNRAGKKVAEEVGRGKVVAKETGESSKMMDQPAKDPREEKWVDENSENRMAEGNWIQVGNATMLLQENSDKGETLVIDATPLKICDPPCFTNCNPADSVEQLLLELASPDKLPRNDFIVERLPEYLVKNTELKLRVMKQRSTSCGPRIKTDRIKEKLKKQNG
ncbi:UNVERIFIED_CONTAM: hypothetical protein Sindi_2927800 [Sesamum indicum]